MASFTEILTRVAEAVKKAGISEDSTIATLLRNEGLDAVTENVNAVKKLAGLEKTGTITGALTETAQKVGNTLGETSKSLTTTIASAITAHPVAATGALVATGAGIYGLYLTTGELQSAANKQATNPYSSTVIYVPASSTKTNADTTTPTTSTTDKTSSTTSHGILGDTVGYIAKGLFGDTGEEIAAAVESAKPWIIGGALIVGIVAVGYAINAVKKNKSSVNVVVPEMKYKVPSAKTY